MSDQYITRSVDDREVIICRDDGYLNVTKVLRSLERKYSTWRRAAKTSQYLARVSEVVGIPVSELCRTVRGGNCEARQISGTYVHPLVFSHILQWVSPSLGVSMAQWVEEWKQVNGNPERFWQAVGDADTYIGDNPEDEVQAFLAEQVGGEREVRCPTGVIDLLTDSLLIEVKRSEDWKGGVGQLIVYGQCYPDRIKVLYLYDGRPEKVIRQTCRSLDIRVAWKPRHLLG